ncbi:MAG: efflux RND transporter periplasmic adaptor subunit [Muribaculaceae bacterium]|nr:efflux RND transporter periplasmic adaptor subunit [Muribaculaceae bacterium]MDE6346980.1 efflux RND transporter periplasmic adaptor subunit [Muribaculaceae bacterium]
MKRLITTKATATLMAVALVTTVSCSKNDDQAARQQMPAPVIGTQTISYSDVDLSQSYPATIKGKTDIEIRPQVSGFITKVLVDEGQHVNKGQTLFVLDQVQYQAAVDQAAAAVSAAQTAVKSAQMTADQKQALFDKNIISEYENQLAKNDLANAKSNLATANASLTSARKNLAYTVVTAPSSGVIGSIPFREGSLASPSMAQPLTTVSDNSQVYAYFSLTEKDILNMTENGAKPLQQQIAEMPAVKLQLADGSMFPIEGKVATVSGVIGTGTGAATVRALFDNPNGMLRSGSTGQIVIPMQEKNAIVIPQKATFELQDRKFVYVVNDSNKVISTPITISKINDGKIYVVTSGLEPGNVIAVEGVGNTLRPNMEISPVDAAQKAAAAAQAAQQ